ncbi:MAG: inner membrane protein, partial [Parcubacteria group bacterium Gr01-1014_70]
MILFYASVFLLSSVMLAIAGDWLVRSLARIARYFGWQEFTAAFFIMSVAVSVPEFLIGVTSAFQGIPELSLGNIIGANIIHFTLALALATIVLGKLEFDKEHIRVTVDFTILFAVLPFLFMIDGALGRLDGFILLVSFFIYVIWVFSKRERFGQYYNSYIFNGNGDNSAWEHFTKALRDSVMFLGGIILLLSSSVGIVSSASFFAGYFNIPLMLVGVFVVALGTALPETYFAVASARRGNARMVVGNLLGSTVLTASFVLGFVAMLRPIVITNIPAYAVARAFLVVSAILLLIFSQ